MGRLSITRDSLKTTMKSTLRSTLKATKKSLTKPSGSPTSKSKNGTSSPKPKTGKNGQNSPGQKPKAKVDDMIKNLVQSKQQPEIPTNFKNSMYGNYQGYYAKTYNYELNEEEKKRSKSVRPSTIARGREADN